MHKIFRYYISNAFKEKNTSEHKYVFLNLSFLIEENEKEKKRVALDIKEIALCEPC